VGPTPFLRGIPKKLRRPTPAFTAPFVYGFDEPGSLKGTPKAGLMQAFTEQQFVHLLELAQGKCRGQKPECNRSLIEASLDGPGRRFDHRSLPWSQWRMVTHRKPGIAGPRGSSFMGDESDERDRDLGVARMPLGIPKRSNLFDPDRRLAKRIFRNANRRGLERFTPLSGTPRK
jgi:hypothetical protein